MISESDLLQHIDDQPQHAAGYKQLIRELFCVAASARSWNPCWPI